MANAGFNAAVDLFSMGAAWKVKSSNTNASTNVAECPNSFGDITHRDNYGEKIAPTAEYELVEDVTTLPALGTVVTVGTHKVAIASITINTSKGSPVTASISSVEVQSNASTLRSFSCGTVAISARHIAQDILSLYNPIPTTITAASFSFSVDVTVNEPKGVITNHFVANGRVVATYTHTSGDGSIISAPTVSGTSTVVSQPVTTSSPENDYISAECAVTKSLAEVEEDAE